MALETSLWGTLPKELLHLVFVRLPGAKIGHLRVLSKEWKKNVDCKDSEFNYVLDATTHLNMFGLLSWPRYVRLYYMMTIFDNIFDVQANKWHVCKSDVLGEFEIALGGVDGGLVCCVPVLYWTYKPRIFIVMNPLTKQKMQLPPLLSIKVENSSTLPIVVNIVKLTMDKKTKEYKVFVVGSIDSFTCQRFYAQVYDSHIKEWMVVEATHGHIIGWGRFKDTSHNINCTSICVYNCADGTLQRFRGTDIAPGLEVEPHCCVLLEDHLFVLHKEASPSPADPLEDGKSMLPKYCISEFHFPENSTAWVKLGVHSCGPFRCSSRDRVHQIIKWHLWGCNGFLLVCSDRESKHSWLYNLSTCEWRTLPAFETFVHPTIMCTFSWSAMA